MALQFICLHLHLSELTYVYTFFECLVYAYSIWLACEHGQLALQSLNISSYLSETCSNIWNIPCGCLAQNCVTFLEPTQQAGWCQDMEMQYVITLFACYTRLYRSSCKRSVSTGKHGLTLWIINSTLRMHKTIVSEQRCTLVYASWSNALLVLMALYCLPTICGRTIAFASIHHPALACLVFLVCQYISIVATKGTSKGILATMHYFNACRSAGKKKECAQCATQLFSYNTVGMQ